MNFAGANVQRRAFWWSEQANIHQSSGAQPLRRLRPVHPLSSSQILRLPYTLLFCMADTAPDLFMRKRKTDG
jgi:hypothetical protein